MRTAVINIKIDPKVKIKAQKVALDLGFSLSSIINGYLKHFIKTETLYFTTQPEDPTEYLIQALKESKKDYKNGDVSPGFSNAKDAIAWLNRR